MLVHFVTDEAGKIPAIRAMLEPHYQVVPKLLGIDDPQITSRGVLMVDADLRMRVRVEQIRVIVQKVSWISERLFVVRNQIRSMVEQAYALGATAVLSRPKEIIAKLARIQVAEKAALTDFSIGTQEIEDGAAAFSSMFAAAQRSKPIKLSDAERATSQVIDNIAKNGFSVWLNDVRQHHEGTYQHCLLVMGVSVSFALHIGFNGPDVKRLGLAATLHDIGKARIPLSILDKPGRLDASEEEIMRRHPVVGYDLLKDISGVTPELLDCVRHHHEYLDGSGYPDGLEGSNISDMVRLLTISDIFAALIESRSYSPAISRQNAYEILCGMEGKLERPLVKAFRNVALLA